MMKVGAWIKIELPENGTVFAVMGGLVQGVVTDYAVVAVFIAACAPARHVGAQQA